eukprot:11154245-Lingulodinium_polyedra.AAC.1
MQFLFDVWARQPDEDCVYAPEEIEASNGQEGLEEGWAPCPPGRPAWQGLEEIQRISPQLNPQRGGSWSANECPHEKEKRSS